MGVAFVFIVGNSFIEQNQIELVAVGFVSCVINELPLMVNALALRCACLVSATGSANCAQVILMLRVLSNDVQARWGK